MKHGSIEGVTGFVNFRATLLGVTAFKQCPSEYLQMRQDLWFLSPGQVNLFIVEE